MYYSLISQNFKSLDEYIILSAKYCDKEVLHINGFCKPKLSLLFFSRFLSFCSFATSLRVKLVGATPLPARLSPPAPPASVVRACACLPRLGIGASAMWRRGRAMRWRRWWNTPPAACLALVLLAATAARGVPIGGGGMAHTGGGRVVVASSTAAFDAAAAAASRCKKQRSSRGGATGPAAAGCGGRRPPPPPPTRGSSPPAPTLFTTDERAARVQPNQSELSRHCHCQPWRPRKEKNIKDDDDHFLISINLLHHCCILY